MSRTVMQQAQSAAKTTGGVVYVSTRSRTERQWEYVVTDQAVLGWLYKVYPDGSVMYPSPGAPRGE